MNVYVQPNLPERELRMEERGDVRQEALGVLVSYVRQRVPYAAVEAIEKEIAEVVGYLLSHDAYPNVVTSTASLAVVYARLGFTGQRLLAEKVRELER